jgi:hypothetical protein
VNEADRCCELDDEREREGGGSRESDSGRKEEQNDHGPWRKRGG